MRSEEEPQSKNSANDYVYAGCCGVFVGGILGGIGGMFLPPLYYDLVNPDFLKDGQWGMIYLLTLPAGVLIGSILGCVITCFLTMKMHEES